MKKLLIITLFTIIGLEAWEKLGGDPVTYAPRGTSGMPGSDPRTWAPKQKPFGSDPRTWAPKYETAEFEE